MVVAELMQQRKWKNYCSRSLGGVDGAHMAATGVVLGASSSSAYPQKAEVKGYKEMGLDCIGSWVDVKIFSFKCEKVVCDCKKGGCAE